MTRGLRVTGAVLAAIFALSIGASSAFAHEYHVGGVEHSNGEQATKNVLTVNSRALECQKVTLTATTEIEGPFSGTTWEIHPTYQECTAFGLAATVTTTNCNYRWNEPMGAGPYTATMNILCGSGAITISTAGCTVTIGSQGPLSGTTMTNQGAGEERQILLSLNLTTIAANVSGSVLICGTNGARTATYTGTILAKGWKSPAMTERTALYIE